MRKFRINIPSITHVLAVVILDNRSVYYKRGCQKHESHIDIPHCCGHISSEQVG